MKIRVQYKHLTYPYLYDGETQAVTRAYGPQATPHVFVFDRERRLRYEGRMDNSYRVEQVKSREARDAIDALLAHREAAVQHTGVFGCSTKWKEKQVARGRSVAEDRSPAGAAGDGIGRRSEETAGAIATEKTLLVSFWATWCGSCIHEFPDMQDTFRMYSVRDLELVTVAANLPDEKPSVQRILDKMHATSRNLLFASEDTAAYAGRVRSGVAVCRALHHADRSRREGAVPEAG